MSASLPSSPLRIGHYQLIADRHELLAPDQTCQRLPRRLVDLLLRLAAEPGVVVGRQQLLDEVWRRRAVADEVLSRAIADLRIALGDDARSPRYIETIPKTGYRLLAEVEWRLSPVAGAAVAAPPVDSTVATRNGPQHNVNTRLTAGALLVAAVVVLVAWRMMTPVAAPLSPQSAPVLANAGAVSRVAQATPLTSDAAWEMHPATSRDGVWLAYARSEPFGQTRVLHLRHLARGDDRVLADEAGSNDSPAFSPDGSELAYRHCTGQGCQWRQRSLHGGAWTVVGDALPGSPGLDWSEAGLVAVLPSDVQSGTQAANVGVIAVRPTGSASWTPLTPPTQDVEPLLWPRWIPGTRKVVFVRGPPGLQSLHWVELDAPHRSGVFELEPSRIQDQRWRSVDELWLASDSAGFRALLQWQPGAQAELLGARGARGVALLPDGGAVLEIAEYDANLHQLALSDLDAPSRVLEVSTRYESHPVLSVDGRWLALVSLREGADQVWLKDLQATDATGLRRASPADAGGQAVRPSFSPDSTQLYFSLYTKAGIEAWHYDLQRGVAERMPALGDDVFALQASSREGEFVFATHEVGGRLRLWHVAAAGAARESLHGADDVDEFRIEGRRLWWQDRGQPMWRSLDLQNRVRTEHAAPGAVGPRAALSWTLSDSAIYAVYGNGQLYRFKWTDAAARWQWLGPLELGAAGPALAVDARHDRVIVARTDHVAVDLFRVPGTR